jgi:hypothetical protein
MLEGEIILKMKLLSKEEREYFEDLEKNFDSHVEKYREEKERQLKEGKRKELEEELRGIEGYLEGIWRGEISDIQVNIRFHSAKLQVLKEVLEIC